MKNQKKQKIKRMFRELIVIKLSKSNYLIVNKIENIKLLFGFFIRTKYNFELYLIEQMVRAFLLRLHSELGITCIPIDARLINGATRSTTEYFPTILQFKENDSSSKLKFVTTDWFGVTIEFSVPEWIKDYEPLFLEVKNVSVNESRKKFNKLISRDITLDRISFVGLQHMQILVGTNDEIVLVDLPKDLVDIEHVIEIPY